MSDIEVADNFHTQPVAGGCGSPEHAPTCPDAVVVQNSTLLRRENDTKTWPAAARAIASAAGVRAGRGIATTTVTRAVRKSTAGLNALTVASSDAGNHRAHWPLLEATME